MKFSVPLDALSHILNYLTAEDIVVRCSLVNKTWLSAARSPVLWETGRNLLPKLAGINTMSSLLALLRRPQFSRLRSLTVPRSCRLGNTGMKQLAELCPDLKGLDLGYSECFYAMDDDLVTAAELFPGLSSVRFTMRSIWNTGIVRMAGIAGQQLVDLRIKVEQPRTLSSDTMASVVANCPNLRVFSCYLYPKNYWIGVDWFTEVGVIALVRGCLDLKVLELCNAAAVGLQTYETIVSLHQQNDGDGGKDGHGRRLRLRVLCVTGTAKKANRSMMSDAIPTLLKEEGKTVREQLQNSCGIDQVSFEEPPFGWPQFL